MATVDGAHPLDRPAWRALTTRQAHLARGDHRAWRFDPDYAPFAAAASRSAEDMAALGALLPDTGELWLVEPEPPEIPPGARVTGQRSCLQMVARTISPRPIAFAFEELTEVDAEEMLALATLTRPGPFLLHTNRLGRFIGVRQDGRLIAMAGERMHPTGYTEVSGVCTHPDWRGRGYAGGLMAIVAQRIVARGDQAFLHVYADQGGTIALYESLGFVGRRTVTATVLERC